MAEQISLGVESNSICESVVRCLPEVSATTGGTPYGASHVAGQQNKPLSQDEIDACLAPGKRVAWLATQLH